MPKPRIHVGWLIGAIVGELLLLAWMFRSKWLPAPAPVAQSVPTGVAPAVRLPTPVATSAASKPAATKPAGTPFTADICGVGKVPLVEKPHDPDQEVWMQVSHTDADGNAVDDPPQLVVDPDAWSPRDQAIDDWLQQRATRTYLDTEAALRNSGDARLLAFSQWLGTYDPAKGGWTGGPAHDSVALALGTQDPVLYGIVYSRCKGMAAPAAMKLRLGGCEPMNAKRWAELDPQNAVPWLVAALEAEVAGDAAAVADAMHHAAQATRYDTYERTLATAVERQVQGEPDSIERTAVELELVQTVSESRQFSLDPVLRYCARRHMDIEGRLADCDRISTFLMRGTSANEWNVALHVAGITDPTQPALESARQLRDLAIFDGHPPGAHWTCRYRDQQQNLIQAHLEGGDVAARLALLDQFERAPPAPNRERIKQVDTYMDETEASPLFLPPEPDTR